jgi:hypothetical protein
MKKLLFQSSVLMFLLVQPAYAESIENFDTDPGWTRFNNPANSNDFGFQDSNLAGGTAAGEAGGFFSVTSMPVWYGDDTVGNLGGNSALSASGILNIVSVDMPYNNNVFIGHFDNEGFIDRIVSNGIGFQILESGAQIGTSEFRIWYSTGTDGGPLFTIVESLGLTRTWSYDYDPGAGSFGSLTVSISGPGGGTATVFLTSDQRGSIGNIDTFGLAVGGISGAANTAQAEIYFDNLIYSTDSEPVILDVRDVDTPGADSVIHVGGLTDDVSGFVDRGDNQNWINVPQSLVGADYIESAQDNADVSDDRGTSLLIEVDVVEGAVLYMFIDESQPTPFPWMNFADSGADWVDTGLDISWTADNRNFNIWRTVGPLDAGTYNFRQMPVDSSFYGIAATVVDPDGDGDGIEDAIDGTLNGVFNDQSTVFSDDFTDQHLGGFTFGSIIARRGDIVTVVDDPADGVILSGNGIAGGAPQLVRACTNPVVDIFLNDGDTIIATCGSFLGETLAGPVTVTVGMNIDVTIPAGAIAFIEELPGSLLSISHLGGAGTPDIVIDDKGVLTDLGPDDSPFVTILDSDDDGVLDGDDMCPATVIPESVPTKRLKKNHWALTDDDFVFDTKHSKGRHKNRKSRGFTTADTAGCSCEQIIEAQGLGKGHKKHGCSNGAMKHWIRLVNR